MLNLKDYIGKTLSTAPYTKSVKVKVICAESPRSYFNEKGEGRQMKICVVGDRESAVKLISYDTTRFDLLCPGNSLVIRNFIPKEDNIVVTRNSKVMITSDITLPEEIIQTGNYILFPPPPPVTSLKSAKTSPLKTRFSVRGKVVQENLAQEVLVKNQHVPLRTITIKDGKDTCRVSLWRDNAAKKISTGDNVLITNVIVNSYQNEVSLSSTSLTTIEKGDEEIYSRTVKIIAFDAINENSDKITILSNDDEEFEIEKEIFQAAMDMGDQSLKELLNTAIDSLLEFMCDIKNAEIIKCTKMQ